MTSKRKNGSNYGYVGLISVLVVGAVATAVATTVILLGLSNSRSSFEIIQSDQAKGLANACAETALMQIRNSTPYVGIGSLSLGQGSCNYSVTAGTGQNRTVTASGFVGTVVRKVSISVTQINPQITLSTWQEIP